VQRTETADVGTVEHPVNDVADARTLKFQVLPVDPLEVVQLTVAAELPLTETKLGSVAVKLIVLGLAETGPTVVLPAIGKILLAGTTTRGFFWANRVGIAAANIRSTDISLEKRFM
jgi:hypothetical protein